MRYLSLKKRYLRFFLFLLPVLLLCFCSKRQEMKDDGTSENKGALLVSASTMSPKHRKMADNLLPLHQKMGPVQPGDWLEYHEEPGQTFDAYIQSDPVRSNDKWKTLYIQLIGEFTPTQRKVVEQTADYLKLLFSLPVQFVPELPLSVIPEHARRVHPDWGDKQLLTTYILDDVMKTRLPKDAVAYIAFTAWDLWPGEGWNFVFGQASLRERVGVWSIYRNGNPDAGPQAYSLCLLRTMKTASHEIGHMLGMYHCIAHECNMNGSNNRQESDKRPLSFCPECARKLWWATGADPVSLYEKLAFFCREHNLPNEAGYYEKAVELLKKP